MVKDKKLFGISIWLYDVIYFIAGLIKVVLMDSYLIKGNLFLFRIVALIFSIWILHNGLITIVEKEVEIRTTGKALGRGAVLIGVIMLIISLVLLIII